MEYVQVTFTQPTNDCVDSDKPFGGIARYEHNRLIHVICGCCGNVYSPDDVQIIRKFDDWLPISEEIIGE